MRARRRVSSAKYTFIPPAFAAPGAAGWSHALCSLWWCFHWRLSWASSEGTRKSMLANRGRDTSPELLIRSLVHGFGLRFRVDTRPLPHLRRTADLVFRPARVAVFIDGCFWHGCPLHGRVPKHNTGYWGPKLARTKERDQKDDEALHADGWAVIRLWEHELSGHIIDVVATQLSQLGSHSRAQVPTFETRNIDPITN